MPAHETLRVRDLEAGPMLDRLAEREVLGLEVEDGATVPSYSVSIDSGWPLVFEGRERTRFTKWFAGAGMHRQADVSVAALWLVRNALIAKDITMVRLVGEEYRVTDESGDLRDAPAPPTDPPPDPAPRRRTRDEEPGEETPPGTVPGEIPDE